jgi:hypothetical protein
MNNELWSRDGIIMVKYNSEWSGIKFSEDCIRMAMELSFCEDYSKWYRSLPWYKKIFYKIRVWVRNYLWRRRKIRFPIIKNIGDMPSIDEIVSCNSFTNLTNTLDIFKVKSKVEK